LHPIDDLAEAMTVQGWAEDNGVGDLWEEALVSCGLDVQLVHDEANRQRDEYHRSKGVICTGIDIEVILEERISSYIRRRMWSKDINSDG
jgi:hypothetical protein